MTHRQQIARLKVTLDHVTPKVERRIEVPLKIRLDALHLVVQAAMGWHNAHLYMISVRDTIWGEPDPEFDDGSTLPASRATLADVIADTGAMSFKYTYDFGDDCVHTVKIEAVAAATPDTVYPRLLAARGACPPEDCGGPWGYAEMRQALADPVHERHREFKDWLGADFDEADAGFDLRQKAVACLAATLVRAPRRTASRSTRGA